MRRSFLLVMFAVLCGACGDSNSSTSPTPTTPLTTIVSFTGTLAPQGVQFYSFTVAQAGTTAITLASLPPSRALTATLSSSVGLGLGTPAGTGCSMSTSMSAMPGLVAQLSTTTQPTIYCVQVFDNGGITTPVDFTIRIVHP